MDTVAREPSYVTDKFSFFDDYATIMVINESLTKPAVTTRHYRTLFNKTYMLFDRHSKIFLGNKTHTALFVRAHKPNETLAHDV